MLAMRGIECRRIFSRQMSNTSDIVLSGFEKWFLLSTGETGDGGMTDMDGTTGRGEVFRGGWWMFGMFVLRFFIFPLMELMFVLIAGTIWLIACCCLLLIVGTMLLRR